MSTRSTVHFKDDSWGEVIVYRHGDGYPSVGGYDIFRFFDKYSQGRITNLDVSYTASHFVVFLANEFRNEYLGNGKYRKPRNPLQFMSLGICPSDPGDIEYRYTVDVSAGTVTIEHRKAGWGEEGWEAPRPFTREEATKEHNELLREIRKMRAERRKREKADAEGAKAWEGLKAEAQNV